MPIAVVNGAKLMCTNGDAQVSLIVTSQMLSKIGNQLAATIMDHVTAVNIPPFGICKTLTAAASGTPTPCVPATAAPWTPGSTSIVLIGNYPGLMNSDMLTCTVGGVISIVDAGQTDTMDT